MTVKACASMTVKALSATGRQYCLECVNHLYYASACAEKLPDLAHHPVSEAQHPINDDNRMAFVAENTLMPGTGMTGPVCGSSRKFNNDPY